MIQLTAINLDKKLSFISSIFMSLSLIAILLVTIFNASFDIGHYELINEFDFFVQNYITESLQLIELIEVLFIILLVELELFHNTDNFDSYFVSTNGKKKFLTSKLLSYLIIILFYTLVIFIQFGLIYLLRFKTTKHFYLIIDCFVNYLVYFILIFFISYMFMLLFKNYFSAMIVFLYYWVSKLIEDKNEFLRVLFPNITVDLVSLTVTFDTQIFYIILYALLLYFLTCKVYEFKDMKVNS